MKKLVILFMLAVVGLGASAQTQQGQSALGINLGYAFDTENPTIGIDYRYSLTNALRINPAMTHYIKKDGLSAWTMDLNLHYLVRLSEMFGFYPIVGADLSFWNQRRVIEPRSEDSTNTTRFGANVGLGFELYPTERITAGLDVKYLIISKVDQAVLNLRVGYTF